MTRDEAIDKLLPAFEPKNEGPYTLASHLSAGVLVDSLAALNLISLEPKIPKTRREKFQAALMARGYHGNSVGLQEAMAAFDETEE